MNVEHSWKCCGGEQETDMHIELKAGK